MKYVMIVGDGMADYPLVELGGKTPLQVAEHPHMDSIASQGICGTLRTLPQGLDTGTDVAILSILGYDPRKYYTGRGPLEAANMGVSLGEDDIAFRCNLVTAKDGVLIDHSAGHIKSKEAEKLISRLKEAFAKKDEVELYTGVSFRHLLLLRGCRYSDRVKCIPPHDIIGKPFKKYLVKPLYRNATETAELLNDMIHRSEEILSKHPVNLRRIKAGENPGNLMWPWGHGRKPQLSNFKEKYGVSGAVISAVDLVNGIGVNVGMDVVKVPGATGYHDTNYEGKADYALKSLDSHDFVLVHVEAPDEASHIGDLKLKIRAIEDLDRRLVGRILEGLRGDYTITVLTDHLTPTAKRTHRRGPVPFAISSTALRRNDGVKHFDEYSVRGGSLRINEGYKFMSAFLRYK
jgi:2,3-bisphosphoglycerate-independent phosphoglycerate mutase